MDHDGAAVVPVAVPAVVHGDHVAEGRLDDLAVDRAVGAVAAGGIDLSAQDGGEGRLVELEDEPRAGDAAAHLVEVQAQALGEGGGEVAAGAGVGEGGLAVPQFQGRGEGPGADGLDLQQPFVALGELLQGVQVLAEPGAGAAGVPAGTVADPPAAGLHARVELHEEAGGAADHVCAGAAGGEFGEVGKSSKLPVAALAASLASVPGEEPMPVAGGK